MSEPSVADPFAEARSRAANALRLHWADSVRLTIIAWATATISVGAGVAAMVSAQMLVSRQGWAVIIAVGGIAGPVVFCALEVRRLLEKSEALQQLLDVQRQYEVLIADARSERDLLQQELRQTQQLNAALQVTAALAAGTGRSDGDGTKD